MSSYEKAAKKRILCGFILFNKIRFFGGFASEKTPYRRAKRVRAPRGADKISDFVKRR
jgi:hypothetical protein